MNRKIGIEMLQREKFDSINSELRSFYDFCKESGMTNEELRVICRPLTNTIWKASMKTWIRFILFLTIIFAIVYTLSHSDTFQWHAAATVRIMLIKLLPIWDWTPLYSRECLIKGSEIPPINNNHISTEDCVACEAIKNIARISDTSYTEVFHHHLLRGAPVIVTDAYHDWSISRSDLNLTELISNDRIRDSVPCRFLTNIRLGRQPADLEDIVSRITNTNIPSWFVHFQNCDIKAVKQFRVLAPRPYFLSPHIPPSLFNWLLLSKNYETRRFKYLELDVGLIIVSQLKGKTSIQLKPREPCEDDCFVLNLELTEGETLVLGNLLWELEYLPGRGENIAMVTETDWNES